MFDNVLIATVISGLTAGLAARGQSSILVKQGYQPTRQGVNTAPTIYLYKISSTMVGYSKDNSEWNWTTETMQRTEKQVMETTFQVNALATQDPSSTTALTAADILNYASFVLRSEDFISALKVVDPSAGVTRIMSIRNPFFIDDKERFEANPSFDFTVTHKQVIITEAPALTAENFVFKGI